MIGHLFIFHVFSKMAGTQNFQAPSATLIDSKVEKACTQEL